MKKTSKQNKDTTLLNGDIVKTFSHVRVVDSYLVSMADLTEDGLIATETALAVAEKNNMDLVLVSTKGTVICKIMDYSKFLFDKRKKETAAANKAKTASKLKEVKLGGLDTQDTHYRAPQAKEFIEKFGKVKVSLFLKGGRAMKRKHEGGAVLLEFLELMNEEETTHIFYHTDRPRLNGRSWSMIVQKKKIKK